jgi:hypothetical protein
MNGGNKCACVCVCVWGGAVVVFLVALGAFCALFRLPCLPCLPFSCLAFCQVLKIGLTQSNG